MGLLFGIIVGLFCIWLVGGFDHSDEPEIFSEEWNKKYPKKTEEEIMIENSTRDKTFIEKIKNYDEEDNMALGFIYMYLWYIGAMVIIVVVIYILSMILSGNPYL